MLEVLLLKKKKMTSFPVVVVFSPLLTPSQSPVDEPRESLTPSQFFGVVAPHFVDVQRDGGSIFLGLGDFERI